MVQRRTCGWGTALGRGTARGRRDGRRPGGSSGTGGGPGGGGGRLRGPDDSMNEDSRKSLGAYGSSGAPSRRLAQQSGCPPPTSSTRESLSGSVSGRTGRKGSISFRRSFLRQCKHLWCFCVVKCKHLWCFCGYFLLLCIYSCSLFRVGDVMCSSLMLFLPFALISSAAWSFFRQSSGPGDDLQLSQHPLLLWSRSA